MLRATGGPVVISTACSVTPGATNTSICARVVMVGTSTSTVWAPTAVRAAPVPTPISATGTWKTRTTKTTGEHSGRSAVPPSRLPAGPAGFHPDGAAGGHGVDRRCGWSGVTVHRRWRRTTVAQRNRTPGHDPATGAGRVADHRRIGPGAGAAPRWLQSPRTHGAGCQYPRVAGTGGPAAGAAPFPTGSDRGPAGAGSRIHCLAPDPWLGTAYPSGQYR